MSAYYSENDPFAAAWLRELMRDGLIAPGYVDERSIEDVRPVDVEGFTQCHFFAGIGVWSLALRIVGWPDDRPIWTGSCPCQPFSAAGKGDGFDDERHLWPAWYWLIANAKRRDIPVVGEQVAAKAGRAWFDLVSSDMEALDHGCGAVDTSAASLGAPFIGQWLYWLAATNQSGSQRRFAAERSGCADQCAVGPHGMVDGLATTEVSEWERIRSLAAREANVSRFANSSDDSGLAPPTGGQPRHRYIQSSGQHGLVSQNTGDSDDGRVPLHPTEYWRDADWLLCRDPNGARFRPVEPTHVIMVDAGAVGGYVDGSSGESSTAEETKEVINASVQTVREATDPEGVSAERTDGEQQHLREASVLQPAVHGRLAVRSDQGDVTAEQSAAIGADAQTEMRSLRQDEQFDARTPSRRESAEQRSGECPDVVRFMSYALTLAELRRDNEAADALRALQQTILSQGVVSHPSDTLETVWRSLGHAAQERIRVDHSFDRWLTVAPFPLVESKAFFNRLAEVRGAGNALNISQAACFIEAVMEYLDR